MVSLIGICVFPQAPLKTEKNFKCAQLFSVFLVGKLQMYARYLGTNLTLRQLKRMCLKLLYFSAQQ